MLFRASLTSLKYLIQEFGSHVLLDACLFPGGLFVSVTYDPYGWTSCCMQGGELVIPPPTLAGRGGAGRGWKTLFRIPTTHLAFHAISETHKAYVAGARSLARQRYQRVSHP